MRVYVEYTQYCTLLMFQPNICDQYTVRLLIFCLTHVLLWLTSTSSRWRQTHTTTQTAALSSNQLYLNTQRVTQQQQQQIQKIKLIKYPIVSFYWLINKQLHIENCRNNALHYYNYNSTTTTTTEGTEGTDGTVVALVIFPECVVTVNRLLLLMLLLLLL